MKNLLIILLICLVVSFNRVNSQNNTIFLSTVFDINSPDSSRVEIQKEFEKMLPADKKITYSSVPRGLIVSINEGEFFNKGSVELRDDGKHLLDKIALVLAKFNNNCMVESHTTEELPKNSLMSEDWELTLIRANKIVDYFIIEKKLDYGRIFPIGFGEIMPFKDSVSNKNFPNNRVDFVIFDYEIKR